MCLTKLLKTEIVDILATDVEKLIKETAKRIFFVEGKLHATTQDIADSAGINRTAIHYYYRSRKLLFDKVFEEAMAEFHDKLAAVIAREELPFRELTGEIIDFFLKKSKKHPFLELFLVAELNTNPQAFYPLIPEAEKSSRQAMLTESISREVAQGTMKPIKTEHFIVNIMSLCSFPFLAKPIVKNAVALSEEGYGKFIAERKEVIMKQIFLDL